MLFLNLAKEKPKVTVAQTLAEVDLSAFQLQRTKVIADRSYEVAWNLKITGETFEECYHCAWTPDAGPGCAKTFSMDGQYVSKRLLGGGADDRPCAALSWFPIFGFFANPNYAVTITWLPTSPTTSVMRSTWVVHEDTVEGVDYNVNDVVEFIDVANEQDKMLCKLIQMGVNSSGYDSSAPYQPQLEAPLRGLQRAYLDQVKENQPAGGKL